MKSLKVIRQAQGISLRKLGEQAGVSYVTLARIEAGIYDPRLSTLRKVARVLKVTVAQVIGDQPFKPKGGSHGTDQKKRRVVRGVSRRG
jgi:transcriptional regulator with XRE-family HTH domain